MPSVPMKATKKAKTFIRTLLADIDPDDLGPCYAHEHIIIDPSFVTYANSDFLLDQVENAVTELTQFRMDGGRALVDNMPCDCGRNVRKLADISKRSGVHIVACTGLHLPKYYDPGHWSWHYSDEQLVELFVAEIDKGIDANDYTGPIVKRTKFRAGAMKVATGVAGFTERDERMFQIAAEVHKQTGCPIVTHTERGMGAIEQAQFLVGHGVEPGKIVISHIDQRPDFPYHQDLFQMGVRGVFTSAVRWKIGHRNQTYELLLRLAPDHASQILVGMNADRRLFWRTYAEGPGLSYLLVDFWGILAQSGFSREHWEMFLVTNPRESFSFAAPGKK